jgi:hypothetical protein
MASCIRPVNGTGGCKDKVLHLLVPASFKNVQESGNIIFNIGMRIDERIPHPCLSGQIDHAVKLLSQKEF